MKKLIAAGALALSLGACANTPVGDIQACTSALIAANTTNPGTLFQVALTTPACVALGIDVINNIIPNVVGTQRARGVR